MIAIALADPDSDAARICLAAYFAELDRIFDGGFDPGPGPHGAGFRTPDGAFLIAARAGQPVGCVGLTPALGAHEVKRLWVAPEVRGMGLARRLMEAAETGARQMGASRLVLDTNAALTGAVALYLRLGWQAIPRYNDNPYAHHWFGKAL